MSSNIIVPVPTIYLTLRFIQLGLNVVVLAADIAGIVLLSQLVPQGYIVNYGPTAWGIWTIFFTFICVGLSIRGVKSSNGVAHHVLRLILDGLLILKWFVLWVYLALSAANIASEQVGIAIVIALAVEAVVSAIQWIICIAALIIFITHWRRAKHNQHAVPTQIHVTPGKMDQSVPLLAQNAPTAYPGPSTAPYPQPTGLYDPPQSAFPQPSPYAYQQQTGYPPQPTVYQQAPPMYASPTGTYPVQTGYPAPTRDIMSPISAVPHPQYQPSPQLMESAPAAQYSQPIQPVPQSAELSAHHPVVMEKPA